MSDSYGTYELNGLAAALTSNNARIGHGGYGSFTHSLGNVSIAGTLSLGDESGGGSGFYYLGLGTLQANAEQIGVSGFGTFTQNNGVNNVGAGGLTLGNQAGSMGRYELNGGTLTVAGQTIIQGRGTRGDHRIVQTGGAAHYDGGLIISDQTWGGSSRYELRGGRAWVTGDLNCNAQGHITLGGIMGVMAVSNNLIFSGGSLDVELGADSAISYLAVSAFGPDAVTLGNPMLTLSLDAGYTPGASAQRWLLIDPTDPDTAISGIFAGMPEGTQFNLGGRILTLSYMGGLQHNDLILTADALPAANTVWMGLGNNYWANATNWIPDTGVPDWTGTIVTFGEPGSNPNADLQSMGRTVGQINFNNSVSTTIHGNMPTPTHGGGTLTLDNNTSDVPISVSGQHTIVAPISLKSNAAITVNLTGDSLAINGTIGEAVVGVGISKLGSGLLAINGIASYTGATTISNGTLVLSSTGQIDSASSIINNAIFQLDGGTHTLGAISGSGTMEVLSGNLSATSITQSVLNNAGTTTISNGGNIYAITGTGSLIVGGDMLTVGSIVQGNLTIGSGAILTIQPITGGPLELSDNLKSVPEPSILVLLGISTLALSAYVWGLRKD
jgi:fibronectin-binding autotransporter adhesin